jgi:RNA polymerase sigma-70 factor, ECF subfamily
VPDEAQEALVRVVQVYLQRRAQAVEPGPVLALYWEDFYRLYAPMVERRLKPCFRASMERDDAFQEVWVSIARKLPHFQWVGSLHSFQAWMAKVIRHKTVDMMRRKLRCASRVLSELGLEDWEPVDGQADPGQSSERHWRREAVQIVLAKLRAKISETNFHILHLHYWDGLTVPEIAGRLGLSSGRISCRLHRLLRKLRRALAPYLE